MRCPPIHLLLLLLLLACPLARPGPAQSRTPGWKAGTARVVITPEGRQWLAGYGSRRPAEGKRHDVWVKVLALEDRSGRRAVLVTSDLVGVSRVMYDRLADRVQKNWGLGRERFMLTYSHNHCAPVTDDVLPDYYPLEPDDWEIVSAYSRRLEDQIVRGIGEAISQLSPATLSAGEGTTDFAVNRRNNREAEVPDLRARGIPLKGPVDHSVPVLAVHAAATGKLLAVAFGYACHPTTLGDGNWCGDYPGFAQIRLEQSNPGAVALFWTGCGGDQNPLPRR
ncbi:MAG: hypothetical protein FJX77_18025, partial [Armatimonadetes bacterium]|nr:hypothetical protein [Armatimonadota bacterium]